jgi:hypothetical protein
MGVGLGGRQENGRRSATSCVRAAVVLLAVAAAACVAEPLPMICPDVTAGTLVITEIRGAQTSPDTLGQWVEFVNVGDETLQLEGLHVVNRQLDDTNETDTIIRAKHELAPGEYFVVGLFPRLAPPLYVDYGADLDWTSDIHVDGILALHACGELVDEVVYHGLPAVGTLSLGVEPPDATANDDETNFCVDDLPPPEGPQTELGTPGTPGEANHPCV